MEEQQESCDTSETCDGESTSSNLSTTKTIFLRKTIEDSKLSQVPKGHGANTRCKCQRKRFSLMPSIQIEPNTFVEASKNKEWMADMDEEYTSLMNKKTSKLVKLPHRKETN